MADYPGKMRTKDDLNLCSMFQFKLKNSCFVQTAQVNSYILPSSGEHSPVRVCWKPLNASIFQRKNIRYIQEESDRSAFHFYGPHLQNRYLRGVLDLSSERVK